MLNTRPEWLFNSASFFLTYTSRQAVSAAFVLVVLIPILGGADAAAQNRREGYYGSEQPDGEMRFIYFEAIEDSVIRIRKGRAEGGPSVSISAFTFNRLCSEHAALSEPTGVDTISATNISFKDGTLRFSFAREFGVLVPVWGGITALMIAGLFWQGSRLRRSRREREREAESRRQLAKGREQERRRLAREIHDGPLQNLLGLRMHLAAFSTGGESEEPSELENGDALQSGLRRAARSLRAMSEDLRPPELETDGLPAALRAQGERLAERFPDVRVAFSEDSTGANGGLPAEKKVAFFRIGQEAMNNAAQHGRARNVKVRLHRSQEETCLEVSDDGKGFRVPEESDFSNFAKEGHYGLMGMSERAELHGIDLSIESEPEAGTRVSARLPRA